LIDGFNQLVNIFVHILYVVLLLVEFLVIVGGELIFQTGFQIDHL